MRLVFVLLPLSLAACVPYPHFWYYAPPIAGVVTEDGHPVVGATIELSAKGTARVATTQTDKDGRFDIGPLKEFEMTAPVLGDRFVFYALKIKTADKDYIGYNGLPTKGFEAAVKFSCDLSLPIHLVPADQYCREDVGKE